MEEQPIWGPKMSTKTSLVGVHNFPTVYFLLLIVSKPPKSNQELALLLKIIFCIFISLPTPRKLLGFANHPNCKALISAI